MPTKLFKELREALPVIIAITAEFVGTMICVYVLISGSGVILNPLA
jgi:hypothetical protein